MDWDEVAGTIYRKTRLDVEAALAKENCNLEDFKALLSPAGEHYLEQMARKSQLRTQKRF